LLLNGLAFGFIISEMEAHFVAYFCKNHLTKDQRNALAFQAASNHPIWKRVVAQAKAEHSAMMTRWRIDSESQNMSDLWDEFDSGESDPTTQEHIQFVKTGEDGVSVRSVRVDYNLTANFYASGSANVGHRESSNFRATVEGPVLTLADYYELMILVVKSESDRFLKIEEDVHGVLFECLPPEEQDRWDEEN
jgi:hypothetical protein